jgi:hypothetical protein
MVTVRTNANDASVTASPIEAAVDVAVEQRGYLHAHVAAGQPGEILRAAAGRQTRSSRVKYGPRKRKETPPIGRAKTRARRRPSARLATATSRAFLRTAPTHTRRRENMHAERQLTRVSTYEVPRQSSDANKQMRNRTCSRSPTEQPVERARKDNDRGGGDPVSATPLPSEDPLGFNESTSRKIAKSTASAHSPVEAGEVLDDSSTRPAERRRRSTPFRRAPPLRTL